MNNVELNKEYICYIGKRPLLFSLDEWNYNSYYLKEITIKNTVIKIKFIEKNDVVYATFDNNVGIYVYPLTFDSLISFSFLNYMGIYLLNNK